MPENWRKYLDLDGDGNLDAGWKVALVLFGLLLVSILF